MAKHIVDESGDFQFRQIQVLRDQIEVMEAHEELSSRLMPHTLNADGSINQPGMDEFVASIKLYQATMDTLNKRALEYGVTAIAPATINIGDRFINLKTWLQLPYITFTEADKHALCACKPELVSGLIGALNTKKNALYCEPHRVTVGEEQISYFAPSTRSKFVDRCMSALWLDVDCQPDKYLSNSDLELTCGLVDPVHLATKPTPYTDLKASSLLVSLYNSFDQAPMTFKPLPPWQFEIFYLTELKQIPVL